MSHSVCVIGGGHNGLVAAWQLSRDGHQVVVLEKEESLGGAVRSKFFPCGCYINVGATVAGAFDESLSDHLNLVVKPKILPFDPVAAVATSSGWASIEVEDVATVDALSAQTGESAHQINKYLEFMGVASVAIQDVWTNPEATQSLVRDKLASVVGPADAHRLLAQPLSSLLRRFLKRPAAVAALLATNVLHPDDLGESASSLPALYLGRAPSWGLLEGGFATLIDGLASAARVAGVEIVPKAKVAALEVEGSGVTAAVTSDGMRFQCDVYISAIGPAQTARLASPHLSGHERAIRNKTSTSGIAKVNMLLERPLPLDGVRERLGATRALGQVVLRSDEAAWRQNLEAFRVGRLARRPYMEVFPLYEIDEGSSCGQHFGVCVLMMLVPFRTDSSSDDRLAAAVERTAFATLEDSLGASIRQYARWVQVLTPRRIQQEFAMLMGNVDHGALARNNAFEFRPLAHWSACKTPLDNVLLGGAGAHPGGLVTGLPGLNVAQQAGRLLA